MVGSNDDNSTRRGRVQCSRRSRHKRDGGRNNRSYTQHRDRASSGSMQRQSSKKRSRSRQQRRKRASNGGMQRQSSRERSSSREQRRKRASSDSKQRQSSKERSCSREKRRKRASCGNTQRRSSRKRSRQGNRERSVGSGDHHTPPGRSCTWPCRSAPTPRPECWSALVPKVEREEDREPWRLPDLRPPIHYLHDRERDSCAACVAPLPLLPPSTPAPH